jgi:hypothetical protein
MLEQLAQIVGLAGSILALLMTFAALVLWLPNKLSGLKEHVAGVVNPLSVRVAALELKSIDDKQLEAALDKAFSRALRPIESRLEGVEKGFATASKEMHAVILELALLKQREGGVDYTDHNARMVARANRD